MTDAAVHSLTEGLEQQCGKCVVAWQSSEQTCQKKMTTYPNLMKLANPTFIVLNLSHVPVSSVSSVLEASGPEEAKNHKGVRVTFMVLKVVSPGWTSVGVAGGEKDGGGANSNNNSIMMKKGVGVGSRNGGGGSKAAAVAREVQEKLGMMAGDSVLMYSYDLTNVRGTYMKMGRSEECIAVSPGMVLSMMVWGRNFMTVFKEQKGEDLHAFDIGIVQMGTRSMQSNAAEKGQMLEMKGFVKNYSSGIRVGSQRLVTQKMTPSSLRENAIMCSRFCDGSHLVAPSAVGGGLAGVDDGGVEGKNINQALMKGNLSSTVSVVRINIEKGQGSFAIGPDDVLRFHASHALSDIGCSRLNVYYDTQGFGTTSKDWVCKLFNVLCLTGSMELLVVVDSYKAEKEASSNGNNNTGGDEEGGVTMDCFARPNMPNLFTQLLERTPQPVSEVPYVQAVMDNTNNQKCMGMYDLGDGVLVVLDTRRMIKRKAAEDGSSSSSSPSFTYSLVHPGCEWEKGYAAHFFYDSRLVHCAVIPVMTDLLGINGSKHVLSTISVMKWTNDENVEFENNHLQNNNTGAAATATTPSASSSSCAKKGTEKKRKAAAVGDEDGC